MSFAASGGAPMADDATGRSDEDAVTVDTGTEPASAMSGGNNGILNIMGAVAQDVSRIRVAGGGGGGGGGGASAVVLPQGVQHPPLSGWSYSGRPSTAAAAAAGPTEAGNAPPGAPIVPRSNTAPATLSSGLSAGNPTSASATACAAVTSPRYLSTLGALAAPGTGDIDMMATTRQHAPPSTPLHGVSNGDHTRGQAVSSSYVPPMYDAGGAGVDVFMETPGVKATASRRRRLLRLEDGTLVVLPTNIYKQAGGVKLDLSLGGIRLNDNRCTTKNRAFNFGLLQGFNRENLLALRAFRDLVIPPDRSNATTIHVITAAEALYRYDEEHQKPSSDWEPAMLYGDYAGWIPDSMDVRVAVMGTEVEMTMKARDLRAVDRHLDCKRALESLMVDPTVLAGRLDLAPDAGVDGANGDKVDLVGMEPGSTGFCRMVQTVAAGPLACAPPAARGSGMDSRAGNPGYGGLGLGAGGEEGLAAADSGCPAKRKKRRKTSVVAEDGVSYELPTYIQNVETKLSRSTLRLKMPLNGFLVNGDHIAVADVVVASGLDVTRKNILALRGCRDAVLENFAGPPLVKRVVAAEVFHVWHRRFYGSLDWNEAMDLAAPTPPITVTVEPDKRKEAGSIDSDSDGATRGAPSAQSVPSRGGKGSTDLAGVVEMRDAGASSAVDLDVAGILVDVAGEGSHPKSTAASSAAGLTEMFTSMPVLEDSTIITLAGPARYPGAPRFETRMTVSDLRRSRQSRTCQFKQLLKAMINDPAVQADKLDVPAQSTSPTLVLTTQNSSGAAAAAAAASAQAMAARALEDTTRAMALLASGRERDGGQAGLAAAEELAATPGSSNGHGDAFTIGIGGDADTGRLLLQHDQQQRTARRPPAAEGLGPLVCAARAKRGRDCVDMGGEDGGDETAHPGGGGGAAAAGGGGKREGEGLAAAQATVVHEPAGASSKQRRQLWMLAIQENELRYEWRKEEAKKAYEARQSELLRWMVDEEAGRHSSWDGGAGPPPMAGALSGAESLCAL